MTGDKRTVATDTIACVISTAHRLKFLPRGHAHVVHHGGVGGLLSPVIVLIYSVDTMRSSPVLSFLRPYQYAPLQWPRPVYLRFHHLARQHRLSEANSLKYPRLQHEGQAMRVPEFRERYRAVGIGTTAEDEVVLRGRIHSIRQASSKLFFFQFTSEFESVQALCNLGKLEEQGVTLADFKKCSKILQRGDIICMPFPCPAVSVCVDCADAP